MMAESSDRIYQTGRRKSAVARVWLSAGSGQIKVNGRSMQDYFPRFGNRASLLKPLLVSELEGQVDITVKVRGGGQTGQAGAISHGLSRALTLYNEKLRPVLKKNGLLTRDARIKERKKYGQPGARKRYQFSKR
jgi:small subunit ribosomal protein S9